MALNVPIDNDFDLLLGSLSKFYSQNLIGHDSYSDTVVFPAHGNNVRVAKPLLLIGYLSKFLLSLYLF